MQHRKVLNTWMLKPVPQCPVSQSYSHHICEKMATERPRYTQQGFTIPHRRYKLHTTPTFSLCIISSSCSKMRGVPSLAWWVTTAPISDFRAPVIIAIYKHTHRVIKMCNSKWNSYIVPRSEISPLWIASAMALSLLSCWLPSRWLDAVLIWYTRYAVKSKAHTIMPDIYKGQQTNCS